MNYSMYATQFDTEAIIKQQMESVNRVLEPFDMVERAARELIIACRE